MVTVKGPLTSGGPMADLVRVRTTSASSAPSGTPLSVTTEIVVHADGPRFVAEPTTSALEVLRGEVVVARTVGAAGPQVPVPLTRGRTIPAQTVPDHVDLVGFDGRPLAAGAYSLRALVGYGGDPLDNAVGGSRGRFVVASEPVDLTVT